MQALLSRDALLQAGADALPHVRTAKFYAGVLRHGAARVAAPSAQQQPSALAAKLGVAPAASSACTRLAII